MTIEQPPRRTRRPAGAPLPDVAPDTPTAALRALQARLGVSEARLALYLGVPVTTLKHWLLGDRVPGQAALRLIEVLGMVEAMAPALHAALMPDTPKVTNEVKNDQTN